MADAVLIEERKGRKIKAKAAQYKKDIIKNIVSNIKKYSIIGIVNMENLPAKQLQKLRANLRGKVDMTMTRKNLIALALDEAGKTKPGVEKLKEHLAGMPGMLFTNDNPFRLYNLLQKSKSRAFAKANQIAPDDIMIPAGPTPFAPGPIIGELATAGIKAGVEGGKVAIKQDSVVAKKGQPIKQKVAEILTRLGIEPMYIGLDLTVVYENGTLYLKDILSIDEAELLSKITSSHRRAFNLAIYVSYPSKDTIRHLIGKAFNDAKSLGISRNITEKGIIESLLAKAQMHALAIKGANS